MNDKTAKPTLAKALVALQSDLKPVGKDSTNPFFKSKYASLQTIMTTIQPLLAKHKLAISQFVTTQPDGGTGLRTILMHENGETLEDSMPLFLTKTDPQGQGSAISYARRYSVQAVLGIVADEDDDGNSASKPSSKPAPIARTAPIAAQTVARSDSDRPTGQQVIDLQRLMKEAEIGDDDKKAFSQQVLGKDRPETYGDYRKCIDHIKEGLAEIANIVPEEEK